METKEIIIRVSAQENTDGGSRGGSVSTGMEAAEIGTGNKGKPVFRDALETK